jgi:hypothetical protein
MVNNMDVNALRRLNEKVKESYVYDDDGDDDDEDKELEMDSTTMETDKKDRRDEVGEVRKMSSKDTNRLRLWRVIVTGVLLLTAFALRPTLYWSGKRMTTLKLRCVQCQAVPFWTVCVASIAMIAFAYIDSLTDHSFLSLFMIHTVC